MTRLVTATLATLLALTCAQCHATELRYDALRVASIAKAKTPAVVKAPAPDWTFDLVVMVETERAGKHTATIVGPARTGEVALDGTTCARLMAALVEAGSSAACLPSGMGQAIHDEN